MEFELKMELILFGLTLITFSISFIIFLIYSKRNPAQSSEKVKVSPAVVFEEKNNFDDEDIDDFFKRIHS